MNDERKGDHVSHLCPPGTMITPASIREAGQLVKQLGERWNELQALRARKAERFDIARAEEQVLALLPQAMTAVSPIGVAAEGFANFAQALLSKAYQLGYRTPEDVVDWLGRAVPLPVPSEQQACDRDTARIHQASAACLRALCDHLVTDESTKQRLRAVADDVDRVAAWVAAGNTQQGGFQL